MPQPDRSHISAMERVEDADPGSPDWVGWINRMVGLTGIGVPDQAIQLGTPMAPPALFGPAETMAVAGLSNLSLPGGDTPIETQDRTRAALQELWTGDTPIET